MSRRTTVSTIRSGRASCTSIVKLTGRMEALTKWLAAAHEGSAMAFCDHLTRRSALLGSCAVLLTGACRGHANPTPKFPSLVGPLSDPSKGRLIWGVAANGYVAQEFLLLGQAAVFEPVSMADAVDMTTRDHTADQGRRHFERKRISGPQPYVTRLVVYTPADVRRSSGNVIVETAHPGGGGSNLVWEQANSGFMAAGDAYVAVAHPVTLPGLAAADAGRYGRLHAQHPSQMRGMLVVVVLFVCLVCVVFLCGVCLLWV